MLNNNHERKSLYSSSSEKNTIDEHTHNRGER